MMNRAFFLIAVAAIIVLGCTGCASSFNVSFGLSGPPDDGVVDPLEKADEEAVSASAREAPAHDLDGDGVPDSRDPDIDNDGVPNDQDEDDDNDGVPDDKDPDDNNDGIADALQN